MIITPQSGRLLASVPDKRLTREEETQLAKQRKKGGSRGFDALNKLVVHSMRQAFLYVMRCDPKLPPDEAFSLCYASLKRSGKCFNPKFGRFFSYAKANLRGTAKRYWKTTDVVRNATHIELINHDADDEDEVTPVETFSAYEHSQPEFDEMHTNERWKVVEPLIGKHLTDMEKMILVLTYTSGFNFANQADLLGITRSAIQRTHASAMAKLRKALKNERS